MVRKTTQSFLRCLRAEQPGRGPHPERMRGPSAGGRRLRNRQHVPMPTEHIKPGTRAPGARDSPGRGDWFGAGGCAGCGSRGSGVDWLLGQGGACEPWGKETLGSGDAPLDWGGGRVGTPARRRTSACRPGRKPRSSAALGLRPSRSRRRAASLLASQASVFLCCCCSGS